MMNSSMLGFCSGNMEKQLTELRQLSHFVMTLTVNCNVSVQVWNENGKVNEDICTKL